LPGSPFKRKEFANSIINLTDPSGYCVGCEANFRVNLDDADLPDQRDERLEFFRNNHWNFFGDIWDVLGREIAFVEWMQNSGGRLSNERRGNWYDVSDAYLAASRFAGERLATYIESGNHCGDVYLGQLEPGVAEWAAFIIVAHGLPNGLLRLEQLLSGYEFVASTVLNEGFWLAHNTALREGVRRADAAGLRDIESAEERALINFILYDVLEPGDQCAAGNGVFCAFTLPFALNIGAGIFMPQQYPATQDDLDKMAGNFRWVYLFWNLLGARPPDPEIHLIR
jgi:hypothetical protein